MSSQDGLDLISNSLESELEAFSNLSPIVHSRDHYERISNLEIGEPNWAADEFRPF